MNHKQKVNNMNYTMNEIKIELFDKCHELVYEYMNRNAKQIKDETLDEYHTRYGKVMTKVFEELSKGQLN
jgi:hypothetical protein